MTKVLIVEDDPMVAQINKKYIESVDGFKVVNVLTDGEEALKYLEKNSIDLVILDIYIYKMDGITLLKKMRQKHIMCEVILVTAAKEIEKINDALKLGVVDYLIKPFEYERLKVSLENYQTRVNLLKANRMVSQEDIDQVIIKGNVQERLPKGLNKKTLQRIIIYLQKNQEHLFSSEEISAKVGVTKVTIRRYMDYMEDIGTIKLEMEYGSVGRPSYRYKYLGDRK